MATIKGFSISKGIFRQYKFWYNFIFFIHCVHFYSPYKPLIVETVQPSQMICFVTAYIRSTVHICTIKILHSTHRNDSDVNWTIWLKPYIKPRLRVNVCAMRNAISEDKLIVIHLIIISLKFLQQLKYFVDNI